MKPTFLRVHLSFLLLLGIGYFTHTLERIVGMYACLLIHECGHLLAAGRFGMGVQYIGILPFGIEIRLCSSWGGHPVQETVTALAGPFASLAAAAAVFGLRDVLPPAMGEFFFYGNIGLGLFNLLPVHTLDGGRVNCLLLSAAFGSIIGYNLSLRISRFLILLLTAGGVWALYQTRCNLSLLLICSFLGYRLWTDGTYGRLSMIRNVLDYKQKKSETGVYPTRCLTIEGTVPLRRLLRFFSGHKICMVTVLDEEKCPIATLSEQQIVDRMVQFGAGVCFYETEKKYGYYLKEGTKTGTLHRRGVGRRS